MVKKRKTKKGGLKKNMTCNQDLAEHIKPFYAPTELQDYDPMVEIDSEEASPKGKPEFSIDDQIDYFRKRKLLDIDLARKKAKLLRDKIN